MIMPANYSVIAENELTYVEGGAFHFYVDYINDGGEVLANNIVTWIGNAYTTNVLNAFIGTWFQKEGNEGIKGALKDKVVGLFRTNASDSTRTIDKVQNVFTNTIGVASAIWVLGTKNVVTAAAPGKLALSTSDAIGGAGTNKSPIYIYQVTDSTSNG